jgi:hypothetical protein
MRPNRWFLASLLVGFAVGLNPPQAGAQMSPAPPPDKPKIPDPPLDPNQQQMFEEMLEQTRDLGPWERQAAVNAEATDLFFQRLGWTSEPDRFARQMMLEIDRVPPWRQQERMEIFLNSLQNRYQLSESQKSEFSARFQTETMKLTLKHFKDMAPIGLEIIKTRAANEPFTAEQVARWSNAVQPLMEEARQMIERIAREQMHTMTHEQRRIIEQDLQAFTRRHEDVTRLVQKWSKGEWDPTEWGLDNDPIHAAQVAEARSRRGAAVANSTAGKEPPPLALPPVTPDDESTWERFVREFCAMHGFDAMQTKAAGAILKEQSTRARNFLAANAMQIDALRRSLREAESPMRRGEIEQELKRELQPVADMFNELRVRLEDLMTAEQRRRLPPTSRPADAPPFRAPDEKPEPEKDAARPDESPK